MPSVIQIHNLTRHDLRSGPVIVVTRIASSFEVERVGRAYVARHRVEFAPSGARTYRFLDELRADLARR